MMPRSSSNLNRDIDWLLRDKYGGRRTAAAEYDIARLQRGEHISYVIGWALFLECRVDLSARPLIPRPETEYWTERAVDMIRRSGNRRPRVLDIFCGSGCVGVAILKHVPGARVDFADINDEYFAGIRKSLRLSGVDGRRARCVRSDIFADLEGRRYDLVLANPPYIPAAGGRKVAKSVLAQEPRHALFGGRDGLRYIRRLLREGRGCLRPGGAMIMEFDPPQKASIGRLARAHGWQAEFFKDQYGRWRFAVLRPDPLGTSKKAVA